MSWPPIPIMKIMMHKNAGDGLRLLSTQKIETQHGEVDVYIQLRDSTKAAKAMLNIQELFRILNIENVTLSITAQNQVYIGMDEPGTDLEKLDVAIRQMKILQKTYDNAKEALEKDKDEFSVVCQPHYMDVKTDIEFVRATYAEYALQPAIKGNIHNGVVKAYFLGEKDMNHALNHLSQSFKTGRELQ